LEAFKKTQMNNFMFSITGKEKRVAFTEVYSKQKKQVPAPNAYKYDIGTIYNKLS
jgi:hypothetical protein